MMDEKQADILIMGHTHESYIRTISVEGNKMVLNCGSVGRSKEEKSLATYLLLDISENGVQAEIIKLNYPIQEVIKGRSKSGIPDFYARFLERI